ncbi:ATP-binding cassette sub-family A member 3 [Lucilia sericata]|uniref:ATP-binding cassette sub-family A member 3 n=1 Tax=Lucilia sericata TaxID=13632 RepID=UPI0018A84536|nr:ATP-binding cassette sub-family A member 3 [Lucilia sericata]
MKKYNIFLLFVYKQLMVLRFHWKSLSVIITALFGLQYLLLYFMYQPINELKQYSDPESPDTLNNGCLFDVEVGHKQTFYAPDTPEVVTFMEQICGSDLNIQTFSHRETMMKTIEECKERCEGVYFEFPKVGEKTLKYTIYTNRMKLRTDQRYVTDSLDTSFSQSRDFKDFIRLQHSIDMNYIEQVTNISPDITVEIGAMPFMRGGYFQNESGIQFGFIFPIFFIILLESTFLVPLVEEKQDGLKEFLVIASPLSYLNGVSFYIVRLIMYLIYAIAVLIVASVYNALGIIPAGYAFILILLFILACMSYTYLISVLFNSVFYAKNCGYLLILPPFIFAYIEGAIQNIFIRIFSLNAFIDAWNSFQIFGNKYEKFEFSHLFEHLTDCSFSIFQIYCILFFQCIVYSILYLYLSYILPGPGGIKQPYLFFLKPEFWQKQTTNETACINDNTADAIIVQDLEKQFKTSGRNILIADRLNMVIKNRQITVLLGHNGAGKTTTINMIMGMIPKDNGKIVVCSERDATCYRHLIGYCPQHSIYMQYMTCKQHLVFFAKLRGLTHQEANTLANKLLQQLNLTDKANEYGKNLSGGMKRRLSLGIAIAGETKIVILDEPSSGLDIESRRELWDILLELRKTKAILITTHHMEEAEVLGDTISILSNGRLQLTGSPLELKHKIGSGYILKLCTNPSQFNIEECLELIREHVPSARVLNVVPPTVNISLPYDYRENYTKILAILERQHIQLGINTVSVTDTTLEDVFLNSVPKVEPPHDEVDGAVNCHADTSIRVPYQRLDELKNIDVYQQFLAIAYKKLLFMKNEWFLTIFLISIPFIMTTIAILTIHFSTIMKLGSGLQLTLNHYKNGIIYMNVADDSSANVLRFSQIVKQQIESYPGFKVEKLSLGFNSTDIEEELIEIMKNDFYNFQQNVLGTLLISGENRPTVNILYSENMMHSSAILANLIDNAIYMWTANTKERLLETIYAPLAVRDDSAGSLKLTYFATLIPFGMFMLMFYFAMLPFKENRSGFKRLQTMSPYIYWGSILICDLLLLLLICLAFNGYQTVIMPKELYDLSDISNVTISIFFYGLTYLPIIYCFANMVTTLSALSTCLVVLFYISFIPPFIVSFSLADMMKFQNYITFLRLLPDFNLCQQLRIINERFVNNHADHLPDHIRQELNSKQVLNLHSFYFYVALVFPTIMFIFLYVVENKKRRQIFGNSFKICKSKGKSEQCPISNEEDRFIQEEKSSVEKIIKDNGENEFPLIVHNLHKQFQRKIAVHDLNFVVRKKECFGLLGVNGAGKTTTFEMIAANQTLSKGTIKIDGIDLLINEPEYRYRFGYCPQNDCLNDFMTAYQTLRYMALLRGIPFKDVNDEVMYWLDKLDLDKYKHVQVKHYSGGTKRKLQTAAAMIGSPSLVLLDEPTTGVDPISRRFLWQSMQDFQKRCKTLVLTSHSMDECEHLCNRLAIMAEGQFKCLGYVPELKQLYGSGFTISIKLHSCEATPDDVDYVTKKLQHFFIHSKLRENHAGILTYFIKSFDIIQWSEVFSKCETFLNSTEGVVEEYSVNETTLEDIFLKYDTKNKRQNSSDSCSSSSGDRVLSNRSGSGGGSGVDNLHCIEEV